MATQLITISSSPMEARASTSSRSSFQYDTLPSSPLYPSRRGASPKRKPQPAPLKSGSRAQPVPEGAASGFRKVGEILRECGSWDLSCEDPRFGIEVDEHEGKRNGSAKGTAVESRDKDRADAEAGSESGKSALEKGQTKKTKEDGEVGNQAEPAPKEVKMSIRQQDGTERRKPSEASKVANEMKSKGNEAIGEKASNMDQQASILADVNKELTLEQSQKKPMQEQQKKQESQDHVSAVEVTNEGCAVTGLALMASTTQATGSMKDRIVVLTQQWLENGQIVKPFESKGLELKSFRRPTPLPECVDSLPDEDFTSIPAIARGRNWTPPLDISEAESVQGKTSTGFLGPYSYTEQQPQRDKISSSARDQTGEPLAKKQRIEVIETRTENLITGPAVARIPLAKKLVTVTDHAIAQAGGRPRTEANEPSRVLQDWTTFGFQPKAQESSTDAKGSKQLGDEGSTVKQGARKRKSTSKNKETEPKPKLPSPKSAALRAARQEIIFGTSSQLVRDEDPREIRELQEAIRVSEADYVERVNVKEADENSLRPRHRHKSRYGSMQEGKRNLWEVGSRGDNDLTILAPESREGQAKTGLVEPTVMLEQKTAEVGMLPMEAQEEAFVDIDALNSNPSHPAQPPSPTKTLGRPSGGLKLATVSRAKTRPAWSIGMLQDLSTLQTLSPNRPVTTRPISTKTTTEKKKKNSTTAEVDISSTKKHEKPKGKGKKQVKGSAEMDPNAPPKKRGRPPKEITPTEGDEKVAKAPRKKKDPTKRKSDNQDEWIKIDEIEDDAAPSPSPPRRIARSTQVQLELVDVEDGKAKHHNGKDVPLDPQIQEELFTEITRRVKIAPRSTDPKRPNWFEKMLLYDPIVLEDLTAWLDSGGLRLQGGKVDARVVQKWCEAHSVCCIWREGLRGGVKKHY